MTWDAVVVGAGHNGLICAAYLARAGRRTLLLEARDAVGGCSSTVDAVGARVNICNCDHITFRTTPILDELGLAEHGLRYLDVDPALVNHVWSGGPAWPIFHDVERTCDALGRFFPGEVEGYRRYLAAARPVAELVVAMATIVPTSPRVVGKVMELHGRGVRTALAWSRRSALEVLRSFFGTEALVAPSLAIGPAVWGVAPATPGTGLGALPYAMRHVGHVGRPVGGSGALGDSVRRAFEAAGGTVRTGVRVRALRTDGRRVRSVVLDDGHGGDGEEIEADVVVAACDPSLVFLEWLRPPPLAARRVIERWRAAPVHAGYESKVDAVVTSVPRFHDVDEEAFADLGVADPCLATNVIAPEVDAIGEAHRQAFTHGLVAESPIMYANLPSILDAGMRPGADHVFSLEVLFTPYALRGGWISSDEPRRWLDRFARVVEPGWLDGLRAWRAVTPPVYETDFGLPRGHAASFAGGPLAAFLGRPRELTRYRTPISGLWLTGAATFPGAGIWGASGRNTALRILGARPHR